MGGDSSQDLVVNPDAEGYVDEDVCSPLPERMGSDRNTRLAKTRSGKVYQVKFTTEGKAERTVGKAWRREVLKDLHEKTYFTAFELESMLNHFREAGCDEERISRDTFKRNCSHVFPEEEEELMENIFTAIDQKNKGTINIKQLICALSTIFRGEKEDILDFWFKMYDGDHDGCLEKHEFAQMLQDVNNAGRRTMEVYVEEVFVDDEKCVSNNQDDATALMTYDDFMSLMTENHILPLFFNPHKNSDAEQHKAFADMTPAEREVLSLLGIELQCREGDVLIQEQERSQFFFFVVSGSIELKRSSLTVQTQEEGTFLGEAALFDDVKTLMEDGSVQFTTSAIVNSEEARVLRMNIRDFYPLVYHEHPGATQIVQRLGRVMMERFEQNEQHLQDLLQSNEDKSLSLRLSSKDWASWRRRLTRLWALRYHKIGRKGKLETAPTKQMGTKEDLSVAYSPGVAEPCLSIKKDEKYVFEYTAKSHLVGVVTNGTAVLGLGNIGPLAAKPVMEGKAVLFKKFADVDAFDIELAENDAEKLVNIVCAMEPTFGGVNLEDIKSPECFYVEKECQRRMNIPVFHDDQHGTAIIAGAGLLNALTLVKKDISEVRTVVCGVGAAGFTCALYFMELGVKPENLIAVDALGVIYEGRDDLNPENYLCAVARETEKRTLAEAVEGADVFLGLSAGNLLTGEMLSSMNSDPIVFACANPMPEIDPDYAKSVREDVILATGRSDFPNQINNVCAFPYIFRGALDCHARAVNEEMKLAATRAIAGLVLSPPLKRSVSTSDVTNGSVSEGQEEHPVFGKNYIIPKPFDERLLIEVASAVVQAAIETGVARVTDINIHEYRKNLEDLAYGIHRSNL